MRVYVAGSMYSPGVEYVKDIQGALQTCGHEISYDWTTQIIPNTGDPRAQQLAEAERDGVLTADLLIFVEDHRPRGALIEVGMALSAGKKVLVLLEEALRPSLFYHLPNCTIVTSHKDLWRAIELLPQRTTNAIFDGFEI